ncbi:hypothetical protein ACLVWU_07690 [Bdellovibrio sp. HCB290]|uniref:hypothetical protein n=1 Tax=Bdellovibrio sp. HCB290 TaxID=3394356 RepID=UPI0039B54ACC
MKMLVVLIALVPQISFAKVSFGKHENKVMAYGDCNDVKEVIPTLSQWTISSQAGKGCENLSPTRQFDDVCSYDVTTCVPEHVVKYQDANPNSHGPNCWNLSLVMKGILPHLRYTNPEEMAFYMAPPLCRQLKDGEARQAGDIGAIRNVNKGTTSESHGFIYISEKLSYSKNGADKRSPYALQSLDTVLKIYGVPKDSECRKNEITGTNCKAAVSYFRCQSLDSYMESHKEIPEKAKKFFAEAKKAEGCVSEQTMGGKALSAEAIQNITDAALSLTIFANQLKQDPEFTKLPKDEQSFIAKALVYRLHGVSNQLYLNEEKFLGDSTNLLTRSFAEKINANEATR